MSQAKIEKLTPEQENELRRVLIERIGYDRIIQELGAIDIF